MLTMLLMRLEGWRDKRESSSWGSFENPLLRFRSYESSLNPLIRAFPFLNASVLLACYSYLDESFQAASKFCVHVSHQCVLSAAYSTLSVMRVLSFMVAVRAKPLVAGDDMWDCRTVSKASRTSSSLTWWRDDSVSTPHQCSSSTSRDDSLQDLAHQCLDWSYWFVSITKEIFLHF